ncbi:hypothetical protein G7048_15555 [Diaphorobacter sp. HDW4B]|uniref:hypothetical protein n=1 Tax=Diaphorobacter sp. HDW4B TaxID=2714925 RepID=UPI00140A4837|nr:hypothetical protein [Diaphorobacter sp. HDW4B]QIL71644.1 hypothetical protein G7048_15555 [Diaphorobacter sp. HDW4B]
MSTLGIRSTPRSVFFAIFDPDNNTIANVEEIKIPIALSTPLALKFIRSTILDVLREYDVRKACIRATETIASANIDRVQIEGVIQEAFASSDLEDYSIGNIASISKMLGIERSRFKPMVNDGINYLKINNWENHKKEEREAILSAIGAKNA